MLALAYVHHSFRVVSVCPHVLLSVCPHVLLSVCPHVLLSVCAVDFVLVWEESLSGQKEERGVSSSSPAHSMKREEFLSRLRDAGLLLEQVHVSLSACRSVCYVLLNAPWTVLCYYAEELSLRAPLQTPTYSWSEKVLERLSIPNLMSQRVPNAPPDYYTCPFRTSKLDSKLGTSMTSMTSALCPQLYEILARTPYGDVTRGEVGVDRLLSEEVFSAAYPLHEVPVCLSVCLLSVRQVLFQYWARWGSWYRYQPLDHIRDYFGEKVALYFAWLGFYTGWLVPAAVMGTVVFLFGFWLVTTDLPAGLLFDNGGTVFFSVFMALWSVTFLEFWKRSCSCLTHRWNCSQYQEMEERPRPEFTAMAPMTTRNPVTGAEEPYFPETQRLRRILTGGTVIVVMVFMVLMFLIAIILYRTIVSIVIYRAQKSFVVLSASRIASLTGSLLNLLVIMTLSRIYISLAYILTRWEMHRTQSKYEDMFILKVFIFQFVNFYSSPVYITFFKGRFIGYPGNYNELFGIRNEDCGPGGCLIELAQELLVIMVGKQLINNIQEFLSPKLKGWWQARKGEEGGGQKEPPLPWETDYQLLVCEGLFSEYLEMVLQFGFITIFVAACPLAPLFALFNNWLEVRLDAHKFVCEYRRPVAERVPDIGIWFTILELISHLAVLSNAFLLAFSSSFVPRLHYRWTHDGSLAGYVNSTLSYAPPNATSQSNPVCRFRGYRDQTGNFLPEFYQLLALRLAFVIIFEHVVFLSGHVIDLMVPDVPEEVETKIKREFYMAKEALAEHQVTGGGLGPTRPRTPPHEPPLHTPPGRTQLNTMHQYPFICRTLVFLCSNFSPWPIGSTH
uniref:Anoctamin n=1 Tax=Gadus morhua TaxID=8049 RepID=A0A8C4ZM08_GADMO